MRYRLTERQPMPAGASSQHPARAAPRTTPSYPPHFPRAQNTQPSVSAVKVERSAASNTLTAENIIEGWAPSD